VHLELSSAFSGTSPKARPSMRMYAHLRSSSHGTWSDGPMCTSLFAISCGICEVTDWVFEIFFETRRFALQHVHEVMLPRS